MLNVLDTLEDKINFSEQMTCSLRQLLRMFFQKASEQGKGIVCASDAQVDCGILMGKCILANT